MERHGQTVNNGNIVGLVKAKNVSKENWKEKKKFYSGQDNEVLKYPGVFFKTIS